MPQATITVKYANPPKGNARSATVKDENGDYWGVHPGSLSRFVVGQTYSVDYVERTGNDGRVYKNITKIIGQQQAQPRQTIGQRPPQQSEDIFVAGVVNHAIAHQSYPLDSISLTKLVAAARTAWRGEVPAEEPPPPMENDYGDPGEPPPF